MNIKLLTEHHLEFLSLKGGCTGLSESTLVKMPHCWKSRVTAQLIFCLLQVSADLKFFMNFFQKKNQEISASLASKEIKGSSIQEAILRPGFIFFFKIGGLK